MDVSHEFDASVLQGDGGIAVKGKMPVLPMLRLSRGNEIIIHSILFSRRHARASTRWAVGWVGGR